MLNYAMEMQSAKFRLWATQHRQIHIPVSEREGESEREEERGKRGRELERGRYDGQEVYRLKETLMTFYKQTLLSSMFGYANHLGDKMINKPKKMITKKVKRMVTPQGQRGGCVQEGTPESFSMGNKVLTPDLGSGFTRWSCDNSFN